jgi:hypothetical protein
MKLLSKSIITSLFSTLIATSAMAQCPSGGCPWGSYNRNYGGNQGQGGYGYSYDYGQGYGQNYGPSYQNMPSYYDDHDMNYSHNNPYPYGGNTYYSDFEGPRGGYGYGHPAHGMNYQTQSYSHSDVYGNRRPGSDFHYGFDQQDYYGNQRGSYDNRSYNTAGDFDQGTAPNQDYNNRGYNTSADVDQGAGSNANANGNYGASNRGSSMNNPANGNPSMNYPGNNQNNR